MSLPVSLPPEISSVVGRRVVEAEVGRERVGELSEAAADDPALEAEPAQRADQRARAGGQPQLGPDLVDDRRLEPGEHGHPLGQGRAEVELAAHGRRGELGHLLLVPGPGRQQVDGLAADQRGVHIHHDQAHRPPVQAAALHRDVDAPLDRLLGQGGAQRGRVGAGDVELDAGHRAVGQAGDPLDVRSAGRDPPGDARDRGRGQQPAEHGDVQAAPAQRGLGRARRDLGVQAEVGGQRRHLAVDRGQVGSAVAGQQHPEHQPAADHDLLDVQHARARGGQQGEEPGGHAGSVPAGHGDEQRHLRRGHGAANATHSETLARPRVMT